MMTTSSTNETAKENFITDHGSTRLMLRRARRGPREAPVATPVRAARTASVTRTAPAVALLTTERRVAAPIAVRPSGVPGLTVLSSSAGAGMPAGRVNEGATLGCGSAATAGSAGTDARPTAALPT